MTPARLAEIRARVAEAGQMRPGPRRYGLSTLVVSTDAPDLLAYVDKLEQQVAELPEATDEDCARAAAPADGIAAYKAVRDADEDMRMQVVKRELTQGVLAGLGSQAAQHGAYSVLRALDAYDDHRTAALSVAEPEEGA